MIQADKDFIFPTVQNSNLRFSRQEYCNGLPCPTPGDLLYPGIEPESPVAPALQAASLPAKPSGKST